MNTAKPAYTPIAKSKTAALSRVLDSIPKGYVYCTSGTCAIEKAEKPAWKFHEQYGIGCTAAQRITRKQKGLANALLVIFWPAGLDSDESPAEATHQTTGETTFQSPVQTPVEILSGFSQGAQVSWLLLVTEGSGPVHERERLASVMERPRLVWLGYELVRHSSRGKTSWTWRRTKTEMAELYAVLSDQLNHRQMSAVEQTLLRISRQPGFAGMREQSWALCQFAHHHGYAGEQPFLFYVQKVSHGVPLRVSVN